jgi:hypothetical protein
MLDFDSTVVGFAPQPFWLFSPRPAGARAVMRRTGLPASRTDGGW